VKRLFLNILSFLLALLVVSVSLFLFKDKITNYFASSLKETQQKTVSLQNDLESGKIVLFGSSELVLYPKQKFLPQNYFNNDLKIPLRVQGNEGQQTLAIMSQLAACDNQIVRENARVVVLLSPSWFTGSSDNGLTMPKFLEFMYPGMMNKLYFESDTNNKYKYIVSNYIEKNISLIKDPTFVYKYSFNILENDYLNNRIRKFIIQYFDDKNIDLKMVNYTKPILNYDELKIKATAIETSNLNNNLGVNSGYYSKNIEPEIAKNNFPFSIIVPPELDKNQEFQDFLVLLDFLKSYKIKPLLIMQDLNPYVFVKNREEANKLMQIIKSKVLEHNFEYMDMWTYKQENYEMGTLTDIVHLGELGWVKVNKKIIEHFMK